MKPAFNTALPFLIFIFTGCTCGTPVAKVSVKLTITPPPPVPKAPEADLKDVDHLSGITVTVHGKVFGHVKKDGNLLVYIGAPYPHQQLMVVLQGDAKTAFNNMDSKMVYVTGEIEKNKGVTQIVVTDKTDFALKPQMNMPDTTGN